MNREGPSPLVFNIVVSYTYKRKMLKRNRNLWNNRLFVTFLSLLKFQAYAYAPHEENKKGVRKFSARFLAFSNEISTVQKIVLSSSRGQGNFRGIEASRPRPKTWPSRQRPRTSKCVLEDSTSADYCKINGCGEMCESRIDLQVFVIFMDIEHNI